jgi:hypothetical protein
MALDTITQAMRADPRVQAMRTAQGNGRLSTEQIRALGFEVPDGYTFAWGGRSGYGSLMDDKRSLLEKGAPYISAAMFAAAGGIGLAGAGSAAGASGAAGAGGGSTGAAAGATGAAGGLGGTLLRYGLKYGVPVAGALIGGRMQANAQRDSDRLMAGYYDRALDAEIEERNYRRGFDEDERRYSREFGEEGRRYGRYSDQYGRESDEDILKYGRAKDDYSRMSDEERLAYDRAQDIRSKNYGYQQYGNFVETLEPYRAGGSAAASRMSGLMGGPTPTDTGSYLNLARTARESVQAVPDVPDRPTWNFTPNRPTWNYPGTATTTQANGPNVRNDTNQPPVSTTMPVGGGPSLVTMRTPGGQTFQVSPAEVPGFEQRGAQRV